MWAGEQNQFTAGFPCTSNGRWRLLYQATFTNSRAYVWAQTFPAQPVPLTARVACSTTAGCPTASTTATFLTSGDTNTNKEVDIACNAGEWCAGWAGWRRRVAGTQRLHLPCAVRPALANRGTPSSSRRSPQGGGARRVLGEGVAPSGGGEGCGQHSGGSCRCKAPAVVSPPCHLLQRAEAASPLLGGTQVVCIAIADWYPA